VHSHTPPPSTCHPGFMASRGLPNRREMDAIAARQGHDDMHVERTESGRRWRGVCSCGFGRPAPGDPTPRTYATKATAASSLIWHLKRQVEAEILEGRKNGSPVNPRRVDNDQSPTSPIKSDSLDGGRSAV
jgi:hypothetical protein